MSDSSDWSRETLPAWARQALDAALKPEVSRSALAHRNAPAWPLLVEAAMVKAFLPRDLAPGLVDQEQRTETEQIVLGFAETTRDSEGAVKWALKEETRAQVLQEALNTDVLKAAIARTAEKFVDSVSRALRDCLTEEPRPADTLDLKSLEARRIAVSSLTGVSGMNLPELDDLDRKIAFRRLLKVFERMIGRRHQEAGAETVERFFGRDDEMESLRDYVGVIPAGSLAGSAHRMVNWLSRTITGRAPLAVWGLGGAGKTTLISKFMLEHAEAAVSQYPFAYLDFDRNTISARRRSGLLMEMCLQVGTQFEGLTKPMADLRRRMSDLAHKLATSEETEEMRFLTPFTEEFRKLVDDYLTEQQSTFEWARPFLLVFDTFEVVQYAEDDVVGLQDFVAGFSLSGEKRMWNRMRLIISGRKQVTNFIAEVEQLPLGALDHKGSAAMLMALAGDAGKPISSDHAESLVTAVAKATDEPGGGVQPLRLKLIGEVFAKESADGPAIVKSLVRELNQPLKSGGLAAQILIDGILIRRVLGHVSDPRVRALADPGLVVRRITPGVIEEVMTRGTSNPSVGEPDDADADPVEPWIIDEAEAKSIFEAFAKEVTLVEPAEKAPNEDPQGLALRHRDDVRLQMLPLIRAQRPTRFKTIHRLAFEYFLKRAERDPTDLPSAAEAIYHGLWVEEPLTSLNTLWRASTGFDLRIDAGEFAKGSPANIYIRAKTGAKLDANDVSKLPRGVALDWLNNRSADLLGERRIEDAINAFRSAAGENYDALGDNVGTGAVLARLLYRSGLWNEALQLASRYLDAATFDEMRGPDEKEERRRTGKVESRPASVMSLLRTSATIEAKSGQPQRAVDRVLELAPAIRDPFARAELAAHAILASARGGDNTQGTGSRLETLIGVNGFHPGSSHGELLKELIHETAKSTAPDLWKKRQYLLRLAILSTNGTMPELLDQWIELREKVSREVEVSFLTDALYRIFRGHPAEAEIKSLHKELRSASQKTEAWNKVDELWRREKPIVMKALRTNSDLKDAFWALLSYEHSDWIRPFGNALTHALKRDDGEMLVGFLDQENFWNRKARHVQGRQRDGLGVVQSAADEGRLLELARALVSWKEKSLHKKNPEAAPSPYPKDIFDIARALLRWHATIVEDFRPVQMS